MQTSRRIPGVLSGVAIIAGFFYSPCAPCVYAQNAPSALSATSGLLQEMAGTWSVQQRMWSGYGAEPVNLPPAIARRRLVEGTFLEESMELAPGSTQKPFNRTAYFNFNAINHQYEYFSLDSRLPQMMNERSRRLRSPSDSPGKVEISLNGGHFVAPQWGKATNVAFTYRLTVGAVEKDRQIVRLYLTPQAAKDTREFRAFEYVYTRQPANTSAAK